ncbi:MAG: hypothetical protein E7394_00605 [Ruminococcaceae bacterium]|nr:hypothetical protein [Oscillospiraceae bacterium]
MSFYYIVDVLSRVGDNMDDVHHGIFADNISSFSKGVCENMEVRFKSIGKKHIFCVPSLKGNLEKVNVFLRNMLNARSQGKVRVKFQYDIKEMMDSIFSGPETAGASLLYTEGKNVFAAGHGEVFVYKYFKKIKKCERVDFPQVADIQQLDEEMQKNSFSRYVGTLESGDEYLIIEKFTHSLLGDEQVKEIFENNRVDVCEMFSNKISKVDLSSGYSMIHIRVKKSLKYLFAWLGAFVLLSVVSVALVFV